MQLSPLQLLTGDLSPGLARLTGDLAPAIGLLDPPANR